jgi:hypothetical protein
MRTHTNFKLQAMPSNIRPRWKQMAVANALAYYGMAKNYARKGLIVQILGVKYFTVT